MNRFNFFGNHKHEPKHTELVPFKPLFDLDNVFEDFLGEPFGFGLLKTRKIPALEVFEENNKVVVKAEIPGAEKKNIKILRDGNMLTISGELKKRSEKKDRNYYYAESFLSHFRRSINLPEGTKQEGAKASYKDGVLTIEFLRDKATKEKGKSIDIE